MSSIDRYMLCLADRVVVRAREGSRYDGIVTAITGRGIEARTIDGQMFVKWENVLGVTNQEELEIRHQEKLRAARAEWLRRGLNETANQGNTLHTYRADS